MKKKYIENDEIDLIATLKTIWDGKWKIIATTIVSFALYSYSIFDKDKVYQVRTEIRPITSSEEIEYISFNNLGKKYLFFSVNQPLLRNLFIEQLNNKTNFVPAIKKYKLIDPNIYSSNDEYDKAVRKIASKVKILSPKNLNDAGNAEETHYTVEFLTNDPDKWKLILKEVDGIVNKNIGNYLVDMFQKLLSQAKIDRENDLSDLKNKIDNELKNYDFKTLSRIAFLEEQLEIAKELEIEKNIRLANIETGDEYYLRGYLAITKEIDLIKSRQNKKLFIDDIVRLEDELRTYEQDKSLHRTELAFLSTSLGKKKEEFRASSLHVITSETIHINNYKKKKIFSIVLGFVIGIIYVLLSNTILSRKIYIKK